MLLFAALKVFHVFSFTCLVPLSSKVASVGGLASEACLKKAFEDLDKEVLRNQPPGLCEVVAHGLSLAPNLTTVDGSEILVDL